MKQIDFGIRYIWASSLPSLIAPVSYAEAIKKTIINYIKEIEKGE